MAINQYVKKIVTIPLKTLQEDYRHATMSADALYAKTGLKRDETVCDRSVSFDNGYELSIKMLVGEHDEQPAWSVILFDADGNEVADVSEDYSATTMLGEFSAGDEHGNTYAVVFQCERCAVPIYCTNEDESVYTAYCDSKWFFDYFEASADDPFGFLCEYTSDEAAPLISQAVLAGAIAFIMDESADEPINCPKENEWMLRTFADVLSEWLNRDYPEASKALDAFLNL